jgi:hypothetical protein
MNGRDGAERVRAAAARSESVGEGKRKGGIPGEGAELEGEVEDMVDANVDARERWGNAEEDLCKNQKSESGKWGWGGEGRDSPKRRRQLEGGGEIFMTKKKY